MSCEKLIEESFVDYWCGELEVAQADALEEHLFECPGGALRAEKLAASASAVREARRVGGVPAVGLTRSALEQLSADAIPVRHYRIDNGETVPCQATADHFSVVHMHLAGPVDKRRVDLGIQSSAGFSIDYENVPINQLDGEVTLAWPGAMVRAQPTSVLTLKLTEVDGGDRRVLGEYKLSHAATEHSEIG